MNSSDDNAPTPGNPKLSHINAVGEANMVDVSQKAETARVARAAGHITLSPETLAAVKNHSLAKGEVLAVARIAGIQGAKKCSELIPLCHPLMLSKVQIDFEFTDSGIEIQAMAKLQGQTGVEMEALTAVSVAALTIYDMCKAMDKHMVIGDVRLLEKQGGKSGPWQHETDALEDV